MLKTNVIVSHFVPLVNENCSFGCICRETVSHLFWLCPKIRIFWETLQNFCSRVLLCPITVTKLDALFLVHSQDSDSVTNTLILVVRKFISQQKYSGICPTISLFSTYLLYYLRTLKMVHSIKNNNDCFEHTWN